MTSSLTSCTFKAFFNLTSTNLQQKQNIFKLLYDKPQLASLSILQYTNALTHTLRNQYLRLVKWKITFQVPFFRAEIGEANSKRNAQLVRIPPILTRYSECLKNNTVGIWARDEK